MESRERKRLPKEEETAQNLNCIFFEPRATLACEKGAQRLIPSAIRSGLGSCSPEAKFV